MNKKLAFITIIIYLVLADIIYVLLPLFKEHAIKACIYPKRIYTQQSVLYKDSTEGAKSVLWEFGNGDHSNQATGRYTFSTPGKYIVRLTIDHTRHTTFPVDVSAPPSNISKDTSARIHADRTGIAGQKIHFKAIGAGIEWCEWHFGKANNIDSRTTESFYSFARPGTYEVLLFTNLNPSKPVVHTIVIQSQYKIIENIVLKPAAKSEGGSKNETKPDEFKDQLQAIADGENFTTHYNFLLKKYLCSNPKTTVVINAQKQSDFYSYCQSLQLNSGIRLQRVVTEINPQTHCVSRILIQQ